MRQMVQDSTDRFRTPFTVSVDAKHNTTTGVSVHDRLQTIKTLISPNSRPEDLARPGHTFPLRAAKGGLKERQGHTEAAVELCRIARLYPAAVICEMMNERGEMAKGEEIKAFSGKYGFNRCYAWAFSYFFKKANQIRLDNNSFVFYIFFHRFKIYNSIFQPYNLYISTRAFCQPH